MELEMSNCRIGKVKFKNGTELSILKTPKTNLASDGLHEFASTVRRDEPIVYGAFVVYKNGEVDISLGADVGANKLHTIGGANMLVNHFEELEHGWKN